jgi:hypothetical protein
MWSVHLTAEGERGHCPDEPSAMSFAGLACAKMQSTTACVNREAPAPIGRTRRRPGRCDS